MRARSWVLAYLPDRSNARRPAVRIQTGAAVPGYVLRLTVVGLGLLCASLVVTGPPGWVVVSALLIVIACVPGSLVDGHLVDGAGAADGLRHRPGRAVANTRCWWPGCR